MNFTVAVKLAREVETICVWVGDCDCVVSEQFLWTPCDVIWAEDGVLQLAGADPSILTLEIRYQRDQTYYGQAFGPTRNTLWAKVWTYGMGISTCLHVHISTYLGTNWLQSTVTYDHCRNAAMLYESTCSTFAHWSLSRHVDTWHGHVRAACQAGAGDQPRRAASRPTNQLTQNPAAPAAGITIFTMRSLTS